MADALTWSFATEFAETFQSTRSELAAKIDAQPSANDLNGLQIELSQLSKSLTDATGRLPLYDQRQYELQLKGLETKLEEIRAAAMPKPKFSFKKKANAHPVEKPIKPFIVTPVQTTQEISFSLHSRHNEYLTSGSLPHQDANSNVLSIHDLEECILNLASSPLALSAIHIRNIKNSVLILPHIRGSIILHDLERCVIAVGCHQFRMHTSKNTHVYLSIPSNPIIEHCQAISFTSYPSSITANSGTSNHLSVQDFSHIRATPSPNWRELENDKVLSHWPLECINNEELATMLADMLPK